MVSGLSNEDLATDISDTVLKWPTCSFTFNGLGLSAWLVIKSVNLESMKLNKATPVRSVSFTSFNILSLFLSYLTIMFFWISFRKYCRLSFKKSLSLFAKSKSTKQIHKKKGTKPKDVFPDYDPGDYDY